MTTSASTLPFPNKKPRNQLVPEINVTPLVDVVLVLLIIFMVIAPQLEAGERVELPTLINVAKAAKLDITTVTITASGRLLLEKEEKTEEALKASHLGIGKRGLPRSRPAHAVRSVRRGETGDTEARDAGATIRGERYVSRPGSSARAGRSRA